MREFNLNKTTRVSMTSEQLAMLILRILQRNHAAIATGSNSPYISYYPYSLGAIKSFELLDEQETFHGIEKEFTGKFAEAVHLLQHGGFIMQDPAQTHATDFQIPTKKGLQTNTHEPELGLTSGDEFISQVEAKSGSLDDVAKAYLRESYAAAEHGLWLSSVFMLGAASERLIYKLSEHVDVLRADGVASSSLEKVNGIRQRKEWIILQLAELKKSFPLQKAAFMDVEDKFDSLYNNYRYQRNGAGHPSDVLQVPDPAQIKAMIFAFGLYAKAVNAILNIS